MNPNEAVKLTDEQLDRLADLLAFKLTQAKPTAAPMLTVEDVSATYQVSRAWVYENAARIGGLKLGPSRRAPLRFDPKKVEAAMTRLGQPDPAATPEPPAKPRRARPGHLLPVYDG